MRFRGLDLNLLLALDVLIERESVTRAAEQLNASQPAISAALARLRRHFGDPLLVPHGKRMVPTAFAQGLRAPLKAVLGDLDALVSTPARFEPLTSARTIRMMASDFILAAVLGDLLVEMEAEAPGLRFEAVPPSEEAQAMLDGGDIDMFIAPTQFLHPDHPSQPFFEETHVIVGWSGNPLLSAPISREAVERAEFISVQIGRMRRASFAEVALAQRGVALRCTLAVPYFGIIPTLLIGTGRLAILQRSLVKRMAQHVPIAWQDLPVAIPPMAERIQIHRARTADPALAWLSRRLIEWAGRAGAVVSAPPTASP